MEKVFFVVALIGLVVPLVSACTLTTKRETTPAEETPHMASVIELPEPIYDSPTSVEQALRGRRSVREYSDEPLTLQEVSQLLWAAQGLTNKRGFRTAPSAGALYPLELYVVVGVVEGLAPSVYKYSPQGHQLHSIASGDRRGALASASLAQSCIREGAIDLVFAAVYERTTKKYGQRGHRYVHMEVGHAAQNVYLQAVSLRLGTVVVGAFQDKAVKSIVGLAEGETPLYIMPVGRMK